MNTSSFLLSPLKLRPTRSFYYAVKDGFAKKLTLFDESAAAGLSLALLETQNGKQGIKTAAHVAGISRQGRLRQKANAF